MPLTLPICLACKILARRLRNRCDMYISQRLGEYDSVWMTLLYIENQSLEIFAFGVVDVYRVVGRLRQLVEYAYVAAGDGSG